jgi:hypothetical protein
MKKTGSLQENVMAVENKPQYSSYRVKRIGMIKRSYTSSELKKNEH